MKTFTIENETNNIIAHATKTEAAAVSNAESFSSADELADLAANWPAPRLIEIWNSIPGNTPVKKFTDRKTAATRIWKAIQSLGDLLPTEAATETEPLAEEAPESGTANLSEPEPTLEQSELVVADHEVAAAANEEVQPEPAASQVQANVGAESPDVAPDLEKAAKKATRKAKTPTDEMTPNTPREASKTSQVVSMLKREGGTTLEEIMTTMNWQKHTARALFSMGGALRKKHGLVVTSEKIGEKRVYSIKS